MIRKQTKSALEAILHNTKKFDKSATTTLTFYLRVKFYVTGILILHYECSLGKFIFTKLLFFYQKTLQGQ